MRLNYKKNSNLCLLIKKQGCVKFNHVQPCFWFYFIAFIYKSDT